MVRSTKGSGPKVSVRGTIKLDRDVLDTVRRIADRDGLVLNRLVDRLVLAGIKAEKLEVAK